MSRNSTLIGLLIINLLTSAYAAERGSIEEGRKLFATYCLSCHAVHKELLGPQLSSITKKRPESWLVKFIRNSQKVILAGDEYANFLYRQYNGVTMPSFEYLSEEQIKNILLFIDNESTQTTEELNSHLYDNSEINPRLQIPGKQLFDDQCSWCHLIEREIYGPALGSITKRRPQDWLHSFIKNSQKVIQSGDPYSIFLYDQYDRKIMPPFQYLSDKEIDQILEYIKQKSASPTYIAGVNGTVPPIADFSPAYQTAELKEMKPAPKGFPFWEIAIVMAFIGSAIAHIYLIYLLFAYLRKESGS